MVASAAFVFQNFIFWSFNVYLIAIKRIMDVDFKGLIFQKYNFDDFTRRQKNNRIFPGQAGTGENISRMFVDVIPSQLRGLR